jgi:hypothetical protein
VTDADARRIIKERDALLVPVAKNWRTWFRRENRALMKSVGNPTSIPLVAALVKGNAEDFFDAEKPYLETYRRVVPVAGKTVTAILSKKKGDPADPWMQYADDWVRTEGGDLIKDVTGFSHEMVVRITQKAVATAVAEGWAINRLMKQILSDLDTVAEYRARRIARTETMRAYSVASRESAMRLGIEVRKRWLTAQDGRGERHAQDPKYIGLNDQTRKMDEPYDVGGRSGMHPHDPALGAGDTCNCRCCEVYDPVDKAPDAVVPSEIEPEADPVADPANPFTGLSDRDWEWGNYRNGDPALAGIYRAKGFDGLPTVLPDAEFDALEGQTLWRGVRGAQYAEQFRSGEYYPGLGVFGNGTYSAGPTPGAKVWQSYRVARNYSGGELDGLWTMKLKPGARVGRMEDIRTTKWEWESWLRSKNVIPHSGTSTSDWPALTAKQEQEIRSEIANRFGVTVPDNVSGEDAARLLLDEGRLASVLGYDAYYLDVPQSTTQYVIIQNRTAVNVRQNLLVPTEND